MSRRRMQVSGKDAWLSLAIGAFAGAGAVMAGPAPTGATSVDAVLVFLATVAVVWYSASAPWWALVVAGAVGGAFAGTPWLLVPAGAAIALGLLIGLAGWAEPWRRALSAALSIQVFARLGTVGRFGLSAALAITVLVVLAFLGLRRRGRRERRIVYAVSGGLVLLSALAAVGLGVAGNSARKELTDGNKKAREGLSLLAKGDFVGAQTPLFEAADLFRQADSKLDTAWTQPAQLVPVVAQHRRFAVELAHSANESLTTISTVVGSIDLESLQVVGGQIDLDAVRALQPLLQELNDTLDRLDNTVTGSNNPWLLEPLRRRLDTLSDEIHKQQIRGRNALLAVEQAPALLGSEGKRVYLVAFTTPAEARGATGFMGSYAELVVDNGKFDITRFGRTADLNFGTDGSVRRVTGPPDWLARYAQFGFALPPDGGTTITPWSNVTMSPDFPATAQVMAELYPESGGRPIDGVIAIDPAGLAGLMSLTGPVTIESTSQQLDAGNVANFLLKDQYLIGDKTERTDVLAEVGEATLGRLLGGVIPSPVTIGKELGPLVSQGHISMWTNIPAEQELLRRIGMLRELPTLAGQDGLLITVNNQNPNKIDPYLSRTVAYTATVDPTTGLVDAQVEITLTNGAPSSGLPDYVIGNAQDLPTGSNRTYLSVFTPLKLVSGTVDGLDVDIEETKEGDFLVHSRFLMVLPGESRSIVLHLAGPLDLSHGYSLTTRPQALVEPETWVVDVKATDGTPLAAYNGVLDTAKVLRSQT